MTFQLAPDEAARARTIGLSERQSLTAIVQAVAEASGIPAKAIRGHDRSASSVAARHLVWWIAHRREGIAMNAIAKAWGADHTSVRHGILREDQRRNPQP